MEGFDCAEVGCGGEVGLRVGGGRVKTREEFVREAGASEGREGVSVTLGLVEVVGSLGL